MAKGYGKYFNLLSLLSRKRAASAALKLFSTPQRGRVREFQKDFLYAAKAEKYEVNEYEIQTYHWPADGLRILLFHGWESNTHRWKATILSLSALNYDIYALDAPAHGASSGKTMTALKYAAAIQPFIDKLKPDAIVAHSVGALATIFQQATGQGYLVKKLALMGAPDTLTEIATNYRSFLGFNHRTYNAMDDLLHQTYGYRISEFNAADFLKTLDAEIMIMHSTDDQVVPFSNAESLHDAKPEAKFIQYSDKSHSLKGDDVILEIKEFLQ